MTVVIGAVGAADSLSRLRPDDVGDLLRMYDRCSPETRFARWHGHTKRFPPSYLERLLDDDLAVLARRGGVVIGFASAARVSTTTWEIGLLVEDAWQSRGVGGQLLTEIIELARSAGAEVIRAEVLHRDVRLLEPLRARGPATTSLSHGVVTADVRPWG